MPILSAVVNQSFFIRGRILMCAWLLLSVVMVAAYTGKLTANSVSTKQPVPFKSLSELVKRTDYRWGFEKDTMLDTVFSVSLYCLGLFKKNRHITDRTYDVCVRACARACVSVCVCA